MGNQRLKEVKSDDLSKRPQTKKKTGNSVLDGVKTRRGEVLRAARRVSDDVNARAELFQANGVPVNKSIYNGFKGAQYDAKAAHKSEALASKKGEKLRVIPVGGTDIGRNTTVLEYADEMIVVDMGFKFPGEDYPGINYIVPDISYIEERKEKVKAVLFTHGHLDHIGAFHHMIPKIPAPVYATKFTIAMLKKNMEEGDGEYEPDYHEMRPENHDREQVGKYFSIEFIRVNHSIPDSAGIIVRTPVGVVYFSGDWRFTPDPLDNRKFDLDRLTEIATHEKIHLMINESTDCETSGRNDIREHDIRMSFSKVFDTFTHSRVFISSFSSQIHRLQMAFDEAAKHGRKVAVAGFSMINNVEMALKTGDLTIPKDTLMKMEDVVKLPDEKITILCTGNQGELNAVLNRMASGAHRFIKLKNSDVVVLSSSRIPGNEAHIAMMEDNLIREGSDVIAKNNAANYDVGCLHASGHGYREDHIQLLDAIHPTFYMPNHGDFTFLVANAELAEKVCGIPRENIFVTDAGDTLEFYEDGTAARVGRVHVGSIMYDDSGSIVSEVVLKDRIHMSHEGIFTIVITVQRGTGRLLSSPDIISRGFIYLRDSEELINQIRSYVKQKVSRTYRGRRIDMETFKKDLRDEISQILYDRTGRSPIIIPVVNEIGGFNSSEARHAEKKRAQDEKDFQAQELARIRGGSRKSAAPRPKNYASFGGAHHDRDHDKPASTARPQAARPAFIKPNFASADIDTTAKKSAPRSADEISFKKTAGAPTMKMWRDDK